MSELQLMSLLFIISLPDIWFVCAALGFRPVVLHVHRICCMTEKVPQLQVLSLFCDCSINSKNYETSYWWWWYTDEFYNINTLVLITSEVNFNQFTSLQEVHLNFKSREQTNRQINNTFIYLLNSTDEAVGCSQRPFDLELNQARRKL